MESGSFVQLDGVLPCCITTCCDTSTSQPAILPFETCEYRTAKLDPSPSLPHQRVGRLFWKLQHARAVQANDRVAPCRANHVIIYDLISSLILYMRQACSGMKQPTGLSEIR